jgi:hypothetical protein
MKRAAFQGGTVQRRKSPSITDVQETFLSFNFVMMWVGTNFLVKIKEFLSGFLWRGGIRES